MSAVPDELREAARGVRLLCVDVDGVLTDGTLYYGADGEVLKAFHVRDGLGIKLLLREGIEVAIVSGKVGAPLERRIADLGIPHAHLGCHDKSEALDRLLDEVGCDASEVAHIGDDLIDLPVFARIGLSIAVPDAHPRVRDAASWVTSTPGGRGAVREVADGLLDARDRLDAVIAAYLGGPR